MWNAVLLALLCKVSWLAAAVETKDCSAMREAVAPGNNFTQIADAIFGANENNSLRSGFLSLMQDDARCAGENLRHIRYMIQGKSVHNVQVGSLGTAEEVVECARQKQDGDCASATLQWIANEACDSFCIEALYETDTYRKNITGLSDEETGEIWTTMRTLRGEWSEWSESWKQGNATAEMAIRQIHQFIEGLAPKLQAVLLTVPIENSVDCTYYWGSLQQLFDCASPTTPTAATTLQPEAKDCSAMLEALASGSNFTQIAYDLFGTDIDMIDEMFRSYFLEVMQNDAYSAAQRLRYIVYYIQGTGMGNVQVGSLGTCEEVLECAQQKQDGDCASATLQWLANDDFCPSLHENTQLEIDSYGTSAGLTDDEIKEIKTTTQSLLTECMVEWSGVFGCWNQGNGSAEIAIRQIQQFIDGRLAPKLQAVLGKVRIKNSIDGIDYYWGTLQQLFDCASPTTSTAATTLQPEIKGCPAILIAFASGNNFTQIVNDLFKANGTDWDRRNLLSVLQDNAHTAARRLMFVDYEIGQKQLHDTQLGPLGTADEVEACALKEYGDCATINNTWEWVYRDVCFGILTGIFDSEDYMIEAGFTDEEMTLVIMTGSSLFLKCEEWFKSWKQENPTAETAIRQMQQYIEGRQVPKLQTIIAKVPVDVSHQLTYYSWGSVEQLFNCVSPTTTTATTSQPELKGCPAILAAVASGNNFTQIVDDLFKTSGTDWDRKNLLSVLQDDSHTAVRRLLFIDYRIGQEKLHDTQLGSLGTADEVKACASKEYGDCAAIDLGVGAWDWASDYVCFEIVIGIFDSADEMIDAGFTEEEMMQVVMIGSGLFDKCQEWVENWEQENATGETAVRQIGQYIEEHRTPKSQTIIAKVPILIYLQRTFYTWGNVEQILNCVSPNKPTTAMTSQPVSS